MYHEYGFRLQIQVDRKAKLPLSEQVRMSISRAIESGLLAPGTRLPSWQALAARLGVARGTVQAAYERLTVGMAPSPLSRRFATSSWAFPGLLLGVATAPESTFATSCDRLFELIERNR